MRRSIKMIFAAGFFLFAVCGVFAQNQAVIRDLAGTVEVKQPGSTVWQPASRGQSLSRDATISTGFKSTAVIAVGDSLLTVRPLTRLTLAELTKTQSGEKVELNLQTGRVRAEVKAQEAGKTEFTVRGSAATASVRGTVFEFDTVNLVVAEGTVQFSGSAGAVVLVDAGGWSYADEKRSGRAVPAEEAAIADLRPEPPVGSETGQSSATGSSENYMGINVPVEF